MAASYNTVTVANTATLILASNNNRRGSMVMNVSSGTVYIGQNANVTTSNGFPLLQNASFSNSGQNAVWKGAIYGIVASGTSDCRYWEFEP